MDYAISSFAAIGLPLSELPCCRVERTPACLSLRTQRHVGVKSGWGLDRDYIGFVGSFYRYQGLQCLLDALAIIQTHHTIRASTFGW